MLFFYWSNIGRVELNYFALPFHFVMLFYFRFEFSKLITSEENIISLQHLSLCLLLFFVFSFEILVIGTKSCFDRAIFEDAVIISNISVLYFASQGFTLWFTAVKILRTSQEIRNCFTEDFFVCFLGFASSLLKCKKFLKFDFRFKSGFFFISTKYFCCSNL